MKYYPTTASLDLRLQLPLVLSGVLVFGVRGIVVIVTLLLLVEFLEYARRAVRLGPAAIEEPGDASSEARRVRAMALMLGLLMPASVASFSLQHAGDVKTVAFPLIGCAAMLLVGFRFLTAVSARPGVLAVVLSVLVLHMLFPALMIPRHVLLPHALGIGNLLNSAPIPWIYPADVAPGLALARPDTAQLRWNQVDAVELPSVACVLDSIWHVRTDSDLRMHIAFSLPELESAFLGLQPNFIGTASGLVLLVVAAWGVGYSKRIDFAALILCLLAAYLSAVAVLGMRTHASWPVILTLANYQLVSGTPLFVAILILSRIEQLSLLWLRITAVTGGLLMAPLALVLGWHVSPLAAAAIVLAFAKVRR